MDILSMTRKDNHNNLLLFNSCLMASPTYDYLDSKLRVCWPDIIDSLFPVLGPFFPAVMK